MSAKYDEFMDAECIPLCDALNSLAGIETFESCCGHGHHRFLVAFTAQQIEDLRPLLVAIHDDPEWYVSAEWASGGDGLYFSLHGPKGDTESAYKLAVLLQA